MSSNKFSLRSAVKSSRTRMLPIPDASVVLRKYGNNAHCWIPGVGYLNGFQAGNFIDSAGTQAGLVDNPVGLVMDAANSGNLLAASQDFDNAAWGKTNSSISQNTTTSPTEAQTADSLIENTATSTHRISQTYTKPASAIAFTFSIYLKANTRTFAALRVSDTPNTSSCDVAINLSTGAIDTPTSTGTFSSPSAQVTNVGNGWYRLSLSGTSNTDTSLISIVYLATSLAKAPSYLGDGTSGIYVWGAQLELGSSASAYKNTITATQGTTANKPILRRGAVNLLTYSDDFSNAAWTLTNTTKENNIADPFGGTKACRVTATAASAVFARSIGNAITGATYTSSVWVRRVSGTGTIRISGLGVGDADIAVTSEWTRFSVTYTETDANAYGGIRIVTSGDVVDVYGPQVELGSTASAYIPTTTAAASSAGGNYYWQFDGSNDSLALSSVPFQMADDFAIVSGLRGLPPLPTDAFCIASTSNVNALIKLGLSATAVAQFSCRDDAGTLDNIQSTSTYGQTLVVLTGKKNGNTKTLRVNGVETSSASTALGITTLTNAGIGYRPLATPANYMNGSIYPVIAIKGTVSDADLLTLEKWVGSLSGVSI